MMEKIGNKLNALAIAIDVGIGVADNIENGTYDRIVPDAISDTTVTAGTIVCGMGAGAAVSTLTAVAMGLGTAAATTAAPVFAGAVAGAVVVFGVSKLVNDYKLPDGKTIRQEVKDTFYESSKQVMATCCKGAMEIGGWLLDKAFG